jgi:hypothetical protein
VILSRFEKLSNTWRSLITVEGMSLKSLCVLRMLVLLLIVPSVVISIKVRRILPLALSLHIHIHVADVQPKGR